MIGHAKRAAIWLAGLLLIVLIGDRLFSFALERILLGSQFRFSRVYAGRESDEVVIVGDSRGVNSVYAPAVTARTGLRALNLSYNGMSMRIAEALVADYLERNAAPQIVIVEITCLEQPPLDLMSEMRTYASSSARLQLLSAEAHPRFAAAARAWHLLDFNSEIFLRTIYYFRRSDQDWINRYTIPPQLVADAAVTPPWSLRIDEANMLALQRTVRSLEQRHVTVRLMMGPYLPAYAARSANLGGFVATVEKRVGMSVWDYSRAVEDPSDFADRNHLNDRGAAVLLDRMLAGHFFTRPQRH